MCMGLHWAYDKYRVYIRRYTSQTALEIKQKFLKENIDSLTQVFSNNSIKGSVYTKWPPKRNLVFIQWRLEIQRQKKMY